MHRKHVRPRSTVDGMAPGWQQGCKNKTLILMEICSLHARNCRGEEEEMIPKGGREKRQIKSQGKGRKAS